MKNATHIALTIGILGLSSICRAAVPPSDETAESRAWKILSADAQKNLLSEETAGALDTFAKTFPSSENVSRVDYMRAERLFKQNAFEKSAVAFERFLREHPKSELADSADYRLGECYYNMGVYLSARAAWTKIIDEEKGSALYPNALESVAMLDMRDREWGKADDLFERLEKDFPQYGRMERVRENRGIVKHFVNDDTQSARLLENVPGERSAFYRGLSLFSLKLFEDAGDALKNAKSPNGAYAEPVGFLKAESFFQKKNYNGAATEFADFVKNFPSSPLVAYATVRRAACALLVKDNDEASRLADQAAAGGKAPLDVRENAAFIKGSALLAMGKNDAAAKPLAEVASREEFPALEAAALVRLAWAHKKIGDFAAMRTDLKRLEEKHASSPEIPMGRYLDGAQYFEEGKWQEAGARFESAVLGHSYTPLSEAGLALMTISYTKAGRKDQLVTAATSALRLFEKNFAPEGSYWRAQSCFFVGKALYDTGRFKEALTFFDKVTTAYGDHPLAPQAQLMTGWCRSEMGEYDKARTAAQVLLDNPKLDKDVRASASFLRASTFFNAKAYDSALVAFAEFIHQYPGDSREPRARYLTGLSYFQKNVFGSAVDEWDALIQKFPADALSQDAHLQIGDLYFRSGDFAKAAASFKTFRTKWPQSPLAAAAMWQELQAYFNAKDDETAIKVYPEYLKAYPEADNAGDARKQEELVYYRRGANGDPQKLDEFLNRYPKSPFAPAARYKLGDMAIEQKAWNRAISEMEQFVRDFSDDKMLVDALYGLGVAYEATNQPDKATVQYRHIMEVFASKPGAIDAAFRLGSLHFKAERYKEALEAFQYAASKKLSTDLQANVQYNIALCAEKLSQYPEAADAYVKFARITKDASAKRDALLSAGVLYKKAEQPAKAVDQFETLMKDPGSPEMEIQATTLLAETERSRGQEATAIKVYERLISAEPASSDARLAGLAQLAYLYEQKKDLKRAVQVYEKMAVSDGKPEWVNAARQRMDVLAKNITPAP
ncbi:MAG: tetratricopeptide repeat protein [Elusimicrobia bacterium]|nr:tetratricopeptide repeat protein [Elusimicrobiota bacterium]